jgi:ATP-binding cassette subfamily B protein
VSPASWPGLLAARLRAWRDRARGFTNVAARGRVPLVQQMSAVECGAACLTMVLRYHGRNAELAEVREACLPGRDGLKASTLSRAAQRFGMRVRGYSAEVGAFGELPLPAIVHWNFRHFVVVEAWGPREVRIVDPGGGRTTHSHETFGKSFTGVVLTMEPGVGFEHGGQGRERRDGWRSYLRVMLRNAGTVPVLVQILAASLLLQLTGLVFPALNFLLVDHVLPRALSGLLPALGVGMLLVVLGQTVLSYLRQLLVVYLRVRLDAKLMLDFFEHLLSLPFAFFQHRSSGDLLMRLGSNSMMREVLTNQTVVVLLDGTFMVVYLLLIALASPGYALLVVLLGAAQMGIVVLTRHRVHELAERELVARSEEQSYLVEAIHGIPQLKAGGSEMRAMDRWSDLFFKQMNVSVERSQFSARFESLIGTLRTSSPLVLLWFGAHQVIAGEMTIGTMLALQALAQSCFAPLGTLVMSGQQLQMVRAHLERIKDVLDAEPEPRHHESAPFQLGGAIEFRDVRFRYQAEAPWVVDGVSFRVVPGQKVAIVGPTGSGKSTLLYLLLGLYPPTSGSVLYDGVDSGRLDLPTVRGQFGVVLQELFVFSGSIRENIALNSPGASLDEVVNAASLAGLHEDVLRMPMQYQTMVGEGGMSLSGGQRQRLCIARALLTRPSLLVLDEATSHLDIETEARVDAALSDMRCTRVVAAHRLSTIRNADVILVMNEGRVVEFGDHGTLMALGGRYADLVHRNEGRNVAVAA